MMSCQLASGLVTNCDCGRRILSGLVEVRKGSNRLGFLGEHHFFGEVAALLPPPPGSWGRLHQRTHIAFEDTTGRRRAQPRGHHEAPRNESGPAVVSFVCVDNRWQMLLGLT